MRSELSVSSPRRPPSVLSERSRASRRNVIDATIACIAEEGFDRATTTRIARRAGVTWGVLQHHFGDKASVMEAVVDRVLEGSVAAAKGVEPRADGSMAQRVKELESILWESFNTPTYRAFLEIQLHYSRGDHGVEHAQRTGESLDRTRNELAQRWLGNLGIGPARCRLAVAILVAGLRGLALEAMTNPRQGKFDRERKLIVEAVVRALDDGAGSKGKRKGTR